MEDFTCQPNATSMLAGLQQIKKNSSLRNKMIFRLDVQNSERSYLKFCKLLEITIIRNNKNKAILTTVTKFPSQRLGKVVVLSGTRSPNNKCTSCLEVYLYCNDDLRGTYSVPPGPRCKIKILAPAQVSTGTFLGLRGPTFVLHIASCLQLVWKKYIKIVCAWEEQEKSLHKRAFSSLRE